MLHDSIDWRFDVPATTRNEGSSSWYRLRTEARTEGTANSDYPVIWLLAFRARVALANAIAWIDPHTNSDDEETVYEWWKGDRKLSAYISGCRVELLRVWGADIDTEMESIIDPNSDELLNAWRWLLG